MRRTESNRDTKSAQKAVAKNVGNGGSIVDRRQRLARLVARLLVRHWLREKEPTS